MSSSSSLSHLASCSSSSTTHSNSCRPKVWILLTSSSLPIYNPKSSSSLSRSQHSQPLTSHTAPDSIFTSCLCCPTSCLVALYSANILLSVWTLSMWLAREVSCNQPLPTHCLIVHLAANICVCLFCMTSSMVSSIANPSLSLLSLFIWLWTSVLFSTHFNTLYPL